MHYMNEYEIKEAVRYFQHDPVLGPAARFLEHYKNEVNRHSDGWPYWSAPVHAAKQLIVLLETHRALGWHDAPATHSEVRKALTPIKAFMTRRGTAAGMQMPPFPGKE